MKSNKAPFQLKILIAEDDEMSALLLSIIVKEYCKKTLRATTGIEAVAICRTNPDIDLILMDVQMPNLNGDEATRQIRQFNKDVVIIAQTGLILSTDKDTLIEAGCNSSMSKPINRLQLLELIKMYFQK